MKPEDIHVGMLVTPTLEGEGILAHPDDIGRIVKAIPWPSTDSAVDEQGNVAYATTHRGRRTKGCCHCSRLVLTEVSTEE